MNENLIFNLIITIITTNFLLERWVEWLNDKNSSETLPKELIGIYDKSLGNPNYDITQLAIMGFVDAIKKLPFFLKLKKEMVELARDADKILLMDSSAFNLPLAKSIRKKYPEKEIR